MRSNASRRPLDEFNAQRGGILLVGQLTEIREGRALVRYAGGPDQNIFARIATTEFDEPDLRVLPCAVLLMLEDGDPLRPIIIGAVRETFPANASPPLVPHSRPATAAPATENRSLVLDLDRLVIEGRDEVVLRCGQGSITLRADGKIVIKGTQLVSRASDTNKIRGASVQIN
jgi:hypothetical protein